MYIDDVTVTTLTGVMAKIKQTVPAAVCLGSEHERYRAVIVALKFNQICKQWRVSCHGSCSIEKTADYVKMSIIEYALWVCCEWWRCSLTHRGDFMLLGPAMLYYRRRRNIAWLMVSSWRPLCRAVACAQLYAVYVYQTQNKPRTIYKECSNIQISRSKITLRIFADLPVLAAFLDRIDRMIAIIPNIEQQHKPLNTERAR